VIGRMGDDSTPTGSHQEAGDDSQRDPSVGDDGPTTDGADDATDRHTAHGGVDIEQENVIPLEVVLPGVVADKAANADTKSAADQ
jgi:hypothetical protein